MGSSTSQKARTLLFIALDRHQYKYTVGNIKSSSCQVVFVYQIALSNHVSQDPY